MVNITFRAEVFKEGDVYVALCPELNVSSYADTIGEAKGSLIEAVEAFVEECESMGSLNEVLEESGFVNIENRWISRKPVSDELIAIPA